MRISLLIFLSISFLTSCTSPPLSEMEFTYTDLTGIGYEAGCTRRDPSDVIRIGKDYYVYYTKVFGRSPGYWGTIWAAKSEDRINWTELGEVLGTSDKNLASPPWDSQAVFTPNILQTKGKYYLYYTAVRPTPDRTDGVFENNSETDFTAIGVAVSDSPEGPFTRSEKNPLLIPSLNHSDFDSYRVDDAVLLFRDKKYWLYYKGRCFIDGNSGPSKTRMGVAFADDPEGPFTTYSGNPILDKSHEVMIWPHGTGVACLASISSTLEYAPDGLDFTSEPMNLKVEKRPLAPGAYRPDLTHSTHIGKALEWGISMVHNGNESYLVRFDAIRFK